MQIQKKQNKFNPINLIIFIFIIAFVLNAINPVLEIIFIITIILFLKKNPEYLTSYFSDFSDYSGKTTKLHSNLIKNNLNIRENLIKNEQPTLEKMTLIKSIVPAKISKPSFNQIKLEKQKKYLHIALNNTLEEAREIISRLPISDRILIEAGTPLIKIYGTDAISQIKEMAPTGT